MLSFKQLTSSTCNHVYREITLPQIKSNAIYVCLYFFKMMFLIGDLGYHFSNFIGDEIDKLCKKFLCNIFMLRDRRKM